MGEVQHWTVAWTQAVRAGRAELLTRRGSPEQAARACGFSVLAREREADGLILVAAHDGRKAVVGPVAEGQLAWVDLERTL